MKITLMGTACAASGVERDNTYLLMQMQESCTLIDVGGNPLGKLKKLGIPTHHVKRVVLTHMHIDHIYGLPSLLWGMWIDGRREPLDIYCAEVKREWLEDWISKLQMNEWTAQFEVRIHSFDWEQQTDIWHDEEISLSVFPSSHGSAPTVGIQAAYKGKTIVYSADSTLNPRFNEYPKIDLLIHEATTAYQALAAHSCLEDLVHYYKLELIDQLVLVHLTDNEPYEEVINGVSAEARAKITVGTDLMTISL
ncbi:ribonuclease Z [Paenibacillus albiflavus]|uniref:Ribonuclease Z n=1 Tax=Paenibacillus albiflavus TaxID=2545760 RepID=A0A4R4EFQ0_9BACL|nr:MBL fold metallo-hydrolase [Paenibacillus albiflavus]TCZ78896.1 ribonuclease Z [Paenibacillus albiflavus]